MAKKSIWLTKTDIAKRLIVVFLVAVIVTVALVFLLKDESVDVVSNSPSEDELTVQDEVSLERLNTNLKDAQKYLTTAERDVADLEEKLAVARAKVIQGQKEVDQIQSGIDQINNNNSSIPSDK